MPTCLFKGLIAPIGDVMIYEEITNKVFLQRLLAGSVNALVVAIAGFSSLDCYARTQTEDGSLSWGQLLSREAHEARRLSQYYILQYHYINERKTYEKNLQIKWPGRTWYDPGDLADAIGVTRQTIGLVEAGKWQPQLCLAICKTLVGRWINCSPEITVFNNERERKREKISLNEKKKKRSIFSYIYKWCYDFV